MIDNTLEVAIWILIAFVPIGLAVGGLRIADRRQRRRSKHLRAVGDA